jgi:hypothetical protein
LASTKKSVNLRLARIEPRPPKKTTLAGVGEICRWDHSH